MGRNRRDARSFGKFAPRVALREGSGTARGHVPAYMSHDISCGGTFERKDGMTSIDRLAGSALLAAAFASGCGGSSNGAGGPDGSSSGSTTGTTTGITTGTTTGI